MSLSKKEKEILEKLRDKKIKQDEINENYFTDSIFYDQVVYIMSKLVKERFEELTAGMSDQEILDQKLQKTLNKRIEQMVRKLESKRKLVVFKQKVKQKIKKVLHKDKASELDKDLDDIERGQRDNLEAVRQLDKDLDDLGV